MFNLRCLFLVAFVFQMQKFFPFFFKKKTSHVSFMLTATIVSCVYAYLNSFFLAFSDTNQHNFCFYFKFPINTRYNPITTFFYIAASTFLFSNAMDDKNKYKQSEQFTFNSWRYVGHLKRLVFEISLGYTVHKYINCIT